jgi:hypothetical protein
MFEEILPKRAVEIVETLSPHLGSFYMAGGTGLGLQIGHRKSNDLDFFSYELFNTDAILSVVSADKVFLTALGTVHCEIKGIRVSFLYYAVPLIYPPISWHGIKVAHLNDIVAEKIKAISQRGSKKDFIDLYAVLKMKYSVPKVCEIFKNRFKTSDINLYHVIKSLVFFEDAEQEPTPVIVMPGEEWKWGNIKTYFSDNITLFEHEFGLNL